MSIPLLLDKLEKFYLIFKRAHVVRDCNMGNTSENENSMKGSGQQNFVQTFDRNY